MCPEEDGGCGDGAGGVSTAAAAAATITSAAVGGAEGSTASAAGLAAETNALSELRSWWEVPAIAHFCSLFRTAFRLPDFEIEAASSHSGVSVPSNFPPRSNTCNLKLQSMIASMFPEKTMQLAFFLTVMNPAKYTSSFLQSVSFSIDMFLLKWVPIPWVSIVLATMVLEAADLVVRKYVNLTDPFTVASFFNVVNFFWLTGKQYYQSMLEEVASVIKSFLEVF